MSRHAGALLVFAISLTATAPAFAQDKQSVAILNDASFWRAYFTLKPPVMRTADGVKTLDSHCNTPPAPANWRDRDFDDRNWPRLPGADRPHVRNPWATCGKMSVADLGRPYIPPCLAHVAMRGRFHVDDPANVTDLTLNLSYRGGAVVYVNGREVARANLPAGKTTPDTFADDYPREVFLRADGKLLGAMCPYTDEDRDAGNVKRWMDRIRSMKGVAIPPDALVKGTNVLSVEIVRSPYDEVVWEKTRGMKEYAMGPLIWGTCAFASAELRAKAGEGVTPNTARSHGFRVWNGDVLTPDFTTDLGDPNEPLRPIRIVGAPGGMFSAKILLGSDKAIEKPRAAMGPLSAANAGALPPASVLVRYALPPAMDGLSETPLDETPEQRIKNRYARGEDDAFISFGAVQPVWITVDVPRDAKPGEYRGKLLVTAQGQAPVEAPVELSVRDWAVPPSSEFRTVVDFLQSPESVALQYDVPIYSERHFAIMEKSFKRLGEIGNWSVYIPLVCRTNMGNEQSMVRWIRSDDGSLTPDFSVMERYLDLAEKHMGRPRLVGLMTWDLFLNSNHRKGEPGAPVPVTAIDVKTGEVSTIELGPFGSPVHREAWTKLAAGLRQRMEKRELWSVVKLGPTPDGYPTGNVVELLKELFPELTWMRHAHNTMANIRGVPVSYECLVWTPTFAKDPSIERLYGWKDPNAPTQFCRTGSLYPFRLSRLLAEVNIFSHQRGFGRVGLDFWPVLHNKRGERVGNLLARFPESSWANIDGVTRPFVPPGPDGAMCTARILQIREGLQECEARIFIESALTDDALRAKLGEELAKRCQDILDERTRRILVALDNHYFCGFGRPGTEVADDWHRWWNQHGHITGYLEYIASGWQDRSAKLYDAAGEVARTLKR